MNHRNSISAVSLACAVWLGGAVLLGCSAERKPASAADEAPREREFSAPGSGDPSSELDTHAAPAAARSCDANDCFSCGESVCLNGFFCDVGAEACAWVPACAAQPSCACLERELPACRCETRDGGLFVSCE